MLERIFPRQIDNVYRGHRVGIWLLGLYLAIKLIMNVRSIVDTRAVATGPDGIPMDSFGPGGAETVIRLFSLLAVSQLALVLLAAVALVRYRAMIPLVYLILLTEHLGRRAVGLLHPAEWAQTSPTALYINLILLALLVLGFGLSLIRKPGAAPGSPS
jgi:hypothetical protein